MQLIVREGKLIVRLIVWLDRRQRDGGVVVQWSTTLRAEARVVAVGMSTAGAVQRQVLVRFGLPPRMQVERSTLPTD